MPTSYIPQLGSHSNIPDTIKYDRTPLCAETMKHILNNFLIALSKVEQINVPQELTKKPKQENQKLKNAF